MKYLRILPAAAGVIALTSVTCFAQDQRENEEWKTVRTRVVELASSYQGRRQSPPQVAEKSGYIYLVEVECGSRKDAVMVDAFTGKILGKSDIPAGDA